MSEHINATPELFDQVENENPGYALYTIRLVVVNGETVKYLVPIEIELTPEE